MRSKGDKTAVVPIERHILMCRGLKVILDESLAAIYDVSTKRLNEQVKRNRERFPEDFCFQPTARELDSIRSQNATASKRNVRYPPFAFTEHGVIMAANVLKSRRPVEMSVFAVRAFIRLRELTLAHRELAAKLEELEQKVGQRDTDLRVIIKALRQLMQPPEPTKKRTACLFGPKQVRRGFGSVPI